MKYSLGLCTVSQSRFYDLRAVTSLYIIGCRASEADFLATTLHAISFGSVTLILSINKRVDKNTTSMLEAATFVYRTFISLLHRAIAHYIRVPSDHNPKFLDIRHYILGQIIWNPIIYRLNKRLTRGKHGKTPTCQLLRIKLKLEIQKIERRVILLIRVKRNSV